MQPLKADYSRRIRSYGDLLDSFGKWDLQKIAEIKRFFECVEGDEEFRNAVTKKPKSIELRNRMQAIGIRFAPDKLAPFRPDADLTAVMNDCLTMDEGSVRRAEQLRSELAGYPWAQLWLDWQVGYMRLIHRDRMCWPGKIHSNEMFDNWYQRRIKAVKSELGIFGEQIDHPILAFELSKGCSISCWFCGFASEKLEGIFSYTGENRKLWRQIVGICVDIFGPHAGRALCYYGTEPYDNPNYLDFLKDYQKASGTALCTATAAPLQNTEWVNSLIRFYRRNRLPWPRISVLSTFILHKIHETYTPQQLRDVRLLMQMKNGSRPKVKSGRLLNSNDNPGAEGTNESWPEFEPAVQQGSIACVSGFLVNMVERSIKIVSPCYYSEKWPKGYRVYGEDVFEDASGFGATIQSLINTHMVSGPIPGMIISLRDDLKVVGNQESLTLQSPTQRHRFKYLDFLKKTIDLIKEGGCPYEELLDNLLDQNVSYLDSYLLVTDLFNQGFLDETRIGN